MSEACGETLYSLYSGWNQQKQAVCSLSDQELIDLMNQKIESLKSHPKTKVKGVMGIIINCEGVKIVLGNREVFNGKWRQENPVFTMVKM